MATKQGRWAEDRVRDWLKQHKGDRASFTFNRILDAHSAMGAMSNPQPGDFQWFMSTEWWIVPGIGLAGGPGEGSDYPKYTRNGLIEVKSVEHTHRLPYKNFAIDQIGRLRIRQMAGSEVLILVAFRPKGHPPYWRTAPIEFFEQRDPAKPSGSWDMDGIDAYTHCGDLLEMHLK
jgi:hypothetical protein